MNKKSHIFRQLFNRENMLLTLSILITITIILLDSFSDILPEIVSNNAILFLLLVLATSELIERTTILPRLEHTLNKNLPFLIKTKNVGLDNLYLRGFSDMPMNEILDLILNGEKVDLLGVSHSEIFSNNRFQQFFLKDIYNKRKKFRVLLLNPKSDASHKRNKFEGEINIHNTIVNSLMIIEEGIKLTSQKLENTVRLYDHYPSLMIIRSDNIMYVMHYVFGQFGDSPAQKIYFVPDGFFDIYLQHFENIWKNSKSSRNISNL